eukprot:TRINITY_DN16109_c0_g11_i1.p1 TRINITY_DN16109_c0_g11~~TRINITY_DN16109_c0_g11_i1.p1  ORF type:complete len:170 (+),score=75.96 TRINITY_DN16109_c0_g11_i1:85-594(+)
MAAFTDTQLKEVFDLFDASGDESIDTEELGLVMEALGFGKVDKDDLRRMIHEVDVDMSGKIEWDEFKVMMRKKSYAANSREEIAAAFKAFAGRTEDDKPKEFIAVQDIANVAVAINEKVELSKFQEILNQAPGQPIGRDEEGNSTGLTIIQWREMMGVVNHSKYGDAFN